MTDVLENAISDFIKHIGCAIEKLNPNCMDCGSYSTGVAKHVGRTTIGVHLTQIDNHPPLFIETDQGHILNPYHQTQYGIEFISAQTALPAFISDSSIGKFMNLREIFSKQVQAKTIACPIDPTEDDVRDFTDAVLKEVAARTGFTVEALTNAIQESVEEGVRNPAASNNARSQVAAAP